MSLSTGIIIVFLLFSSIGVIIALADKLFTVDDDEHEESGDETIEGAEESSRWLNGFALQVLSALYAHIRDISKVLLSLLKPIALCVEAIARYSIFWFLVWLASSFYFGAIFAIGLAIACWPITFFALLFLAYGEHSGRPSEMVATSVGFLVLVGTPIALVLMSDREFFDLEEISREYGLGDKIITWKNIGLILAVMLCLPLLIPFALLVLAGEGAGAGSSTTSQNSGSPGRAAIAAGLIGYWIGSSRRHK